MGYYGYPKYVSAAEKKAKAAKSAEKLRKKNPNIAPIVIEGRTIAKTWWGKAWNKNLESYADYDNRIDRGRSYVRNGAVLDLQIDESVVTAKVQGSKAKPYDVKITISPVKKEVWKKIVSECSGRIDSMEELLAGRFPKALEESFLSHNNGLFPAPGEIRFSCSCPDGAYMCKHIAAALYGIGARLDERPELFFTLRAADISSLVSQALEKKSEELLRSAEGAGKKSGRVLDGDLSALFGVDMLDEPEETKPASAPVPAPAPKRRGRPPKEAEPVPATDPAPKKRGRPPKKKTLS